MSRSLVLLLIGLFASACASLPAPDAASASHAPLPQHARHPGQMASFHPGGWDHLSPAAEPSPPLIELGTEEAELRTTVLEVLEAKGPSLDALAREGVARALVQGQRDHDLPVFLMLGLMEQESRFNPAARGPRGALGLMQVRPFVGRAVAGRHEIPWSGPGTLHDPVHNVQIALAYLSELKREFGTPELALAAYHIGPTRTRQRLAAGYSLKGPYVTQVLGRSQRLSGAYRAETATGG